MTCRGTCSLPGCDRPVHSCRLCSKHYYRLQRHGDPRYRAWQCPVCAETFRAESRAIYCPDGYWCERLAMIDRKSELDRMARRSPEHPERWARALLDRGYQRVGRRGVRPAGPVLTTYRYGPLYVVAFTPVEEDEQEEAA